MLCVLCEGQMEKDVIQDDSDHKRQKERKEEHGGWFSINKAAFD